MGERWCRLVSLCGGLLVSLGYLLASLLHHHLLLYLGLGLCLGRHYTYTYRHIVKIFDKTKSLRTFSGSFTATITFLQLLFLYALTWKINLDPWLISKRKFENGFNFIYCYRKFSVTVPLKYKLSVFKNL